MGRAVIPMHNEEVFGKFSSNLTLLQHRNFVMLYICVCVCVCVCARVCVGNGLETQDKSLALHRAFEKHLLEDLMPRKGIRGHLWVRLPGTSLSSASAVGLYG